jgi:hypothetical protein
VPAELRHGQSAVVLVGDFNPAIFHPAWLEEHELIRPDEAAAAEVQIVQSEVASFTLPGFSIQVLRNRLDILADEQRPAPDTLRDLAVGVLRLLSHTPVRALGLNLHRHYQTGDEHEAANLLAALAPADPWQTVLAEPRAKSIEVASADADAGPNGAVVNTTVQPSEVFAPGIFVLVNHHVDIQRVSGGATARVASEALQAGWDHAREHAVAIADHVAGAS